MDFFLYLCALNCVIYIKLPIWASKLIYKVMIQLKELQLSNFKCFDETPKIEFGKITLLLGANSAGKSSLMYSMLCIFQSIPTLLRLSLNQDFIHLGNFEEAAFNHEKNRVMHINFVLAKDGVDYTYKTSWRCDEQSNQPVLKMLSCESDHYKYKIRENLSGGRHYLLDLKYDYRLTQAATDTHEQTLRSLQEFVLSGKVPYTNPTEYSQQLAAWFSPIEKQDILIDINANSNMMIKTDSHASMIFNLVSYDSSRVISEYVKNMNYISSYRSPALRLYTEMPVVNGKVQPSGNGFVTELLKWSTEDPQRYLALIESLRSLGMLYAVESARREEGNFVVRVQVNEDGPKANLYDVGFGISQLLPIIVGDFELEDESTLFAAQPEIHLHPSVQANLGDYFTTQVKSAHKNYVIETHSECLMNRLRLKIVKGELQPEDVRVYYLNQENNKSVVHEIKFLKDGRIVGAPEDFFETYMVDVMNIAMEAAE